MESYNKPLTGNAMAKALKRAGIEPEAKGTDADTSAEPKVESKPKADAEATKNKSEAKEKEQSKERREVESKEAGNEAATETARQGKVDGLVYIDKAVDDVISKHLSEHGLETVKHARKISQGKAEAPDITKSGDSIPRLKWEKVSDVISEDLSAHGPERVKHARELSQTKTEASSAVKPNKAEEPIVELAAKPTAETIIKSAAEPAVEPAEQHEANHDFVVGSIDRSRTVDELAEQAAEERLANGDSQKDDLKKNGRLRMRAKLRRVWRNSPMAREYYRTKYRHEASVELSDAMERMNRENHFGQVQGEDGNWRAMTAEEIADRAQTDSNYALFNMISTSAPETLRAVLKETDKTELSPNDPDYQATYNLVSQFATRNADGDWAMSAEEFQERADEINTRMHGAESGALDNFMAQALYVRGQVEHGEALEDVMKGFHMFDARANESVNTDAQRTKVDRLVRRYENSPLGRTRLGAMLKPEYVAAATSTALALAQTLSRSRVAQLASVGGTAALSGVFSALREGERTSIAYANYNRAVAMGAKPNSGDSRFNRRLAETTLATEPAKVITENMLSVAESDDVNSMRQALADFYLRNGVGVRKGADLISYSAGNQVNVERNQMMSASLQLQTAYINRMHAKNPDFSEEDFISWREGLQNMMDEMAEQDAKKRRTIGGGRVESQEALQLYSEVDRGQAAYRKLRRRRTLSAGLKSTARSLVISGAAQEVMALANPNVQGVTEALQGRNTDASGRTFLADIANRHGLGASALDPNQLGTNKELTQQQVEELRRQGYEVTARNVNIEETTAQQHQTAAEFTAGNRAVTARHWLDNNTRSFEQRELRLDLPGQSQTGDLQFRIDGGAHGGGLNYSREQIMDLARDGHLKFAISPTKDTMGRPIILSGHLEGNRLVADDPGNSSLLEAIRNNDVSRIEVVDTTNFDSTGALNVFATETGRGTANDIISEVTSRVSTPLYDVGVPTVTGNVVPQVITAGVPASARGYYSPAIPSGRRGANRTSAPAGTARQATRETAPGAGAEWHMPEKAIESDNEAQADFWRTIGQVVGDEDGASLRSRLDEFLRQYTDSVDKVVVYPRAPELEPGEDQAAYQDRYKSWNMTINNPDIQAIVKRNQDLKDAVAGPLDDLLSITEDGTNDRSSLLFFSQAATAGVLNIVAKVDSEVEGIKRNVFERNSLDTSNWSISPDAVARLIAYDRVLNDGQSSLQRQITEQVDDFIDESKQGNDSAEAQTNPAAGAAEIDLAEAGSTEVEFGDGSAKNLLNQLKEMRNIEGFSLTGLVNFNAATSDVDKQQPLKGLDNYVQQRDDGSFALTELGNRVMEQLTRENGLLQSDSFERIASKQYERLRSNPTMAYADDSFVQGFAALIAFNNFLKRGEKARVRVTPLGDEQRDVTASVTPRTAREVSTEDAVTGDLFDQA